MTRATALIALALLVGSRARAQEIREIHVGDRVRVTLASRVAPAPLIGTVLAVSPDTLVVEREEGGSRKLTPRQVELLDVSVSRPVDPFGAAGYGILTALPLVIPFGLGAAVIASEYGVTFFAIFLPVLAIPAAIGMIIGGGPQDVWIEGTWPTAAAPSETAPRIVPGDTLAPALPDTTAF